MFERNETGNVYWIVGDKKIYERFDAAIYSKQTNQEINFYFHDDIFNTYDWTVEPTEEWEDLLHQRAIQVRDNFQYLRLWYSGGIDSHTMLLTFLKHNIFIDEIAMKRDSPFDDFMFKSEDEINKIAIPFINTIKNQIPHTKITMVDIGSKEYKQQFSSEHFFQEYKSLQFKPIIFRQLYSLIPSLLDPLKHTNSLCELRGDFKPKVSIENGKYYTAMYDVTMDAEKVGDRNIELFFTTPAMPILHIKQSHLLMKYLKTHYSDLNDEKINKLNRTDVAYRHHINPSCRYPLPFDISLGKDAYTGMGLKQRLILERLKIENCDIYDRFKSMHINLTSRHMEFFNDNNSAKGFVGVLAKKYFLE